MQKEVIIGIASLPEREECLKDTVYSLLHQCDKMIIGLNNYTDIPTFLIHPKIETYLLDNSLGDAAKFLMVDNYTNHYYLTVDDDIIYPNNYVKYLTDKCKEYNVPVALHGATFRHPIKSMYIDRNVYHCLQEIKNDTQVDYIGTGVLCFDTSLMSVSLNDFKEKNMADIWFGDIMNRNNIKAYVVKHSKDYLTYNPMMINNNLHTIFDEYVRTRNDNKQTEIVQSWYDI